VLVLREMALLELDLEATNEASLIRQGLHEFLDSFQSRLIEIDQLLSEHIFRVMPVAVQ
jgi:HPt (histidine-containing phosphotransfer) domain-containing protein